MIFSGGKTNQNGRVYWRDHGGKMFTWRASPHTRPAWPCRSDLPDMSNGFHSSAGRIEPARSTLHGVVFAILQKRPCIALVVVNRLARG
jgi:hypothetical protein